MIEEGIVRHVDKEPAGSTVLLCGARHRQGAAFVQQAVVCLIFDRRAWLLLLHIGSETAALQHKAGDHTMENSVVVEAVVDVIHKVFHRDGCFLVIKFQFNIAR